jgi:hypothetical protein
MCSRTTAPTLLSRTTLSHMALAALVALSMGVAVARAQDPPRELFVKVGELVKGDGTRAVGNVALDERFAVVVGVGAVFVFTRGQDDWHETVTLTPDESAPGFGRSVAVDNDFVVVGADAAVYIFWAMRVGAPIGPFWRQVAKLTPDDGAPSFGASVAISGNTIVVGAPLPPAPFRGPGATYVFERDEGGVMAWGQVARLTGSPHVQPGLNDFFGGSVSIDLDTLVVGAVRPFSLFTSSAPAAYVFYRTGTVHHAWEMVRTLPLRVTPFLDPDHADVAVSDSLVVVGTAGPFNPNQAAYVFERDQDGPDAWGEVAELVPSQRGLEFASTVRLHGHVAMVSAVHGPSFVTHVFARNQRGADAWGEVALLPGSAHRSMAINHDTLIVSHPLGVMEVYVSDVDGDGIRDGADVCPRDPLNNIGARCQRVIAAYPVLNELVTLTDLTIVSRGLIIDESGVSRHDPFIIAVTFVNSSERTIADPFFEVIELTGGNLLATVDVGFAPGELVRGVGATLSPDVGDGLLRPGDSMTVEFRIQLETLNPFRFFVALRGDPIP